MNVKRMRRARYEMRLVGHKRFFLPIVLAVRKLASWHGWQNVLIRRCTTALALFFLYLAITTSLNDTQQLIFALISVCSAFLVSKVPGRLITQVLIILSFVASTRYLYWRVTETMFLDNWLDFVFGFGLFMAELYAWLVLAIGFFQTAWPLERKPVPLPPDQDQWPTVDIFIPTYNEPLKVVKPTVLAALAIDWPKDKIKVYILDDGKRTEFEDFANEVGVTHLTRTDNHHAKAGNINRALEKTSGEYIAIFDCDHIPTRTFLQVCMGWFFKDKKLVMLQTPHHFFSPDPFEKNLSTFKKVPNEGELFYGLVQDGNDLWNATFFCGSCAVIQRKALLEIGGIAVETVTEDAHTALKLHRLGYSTAYLAVAQAAGYATESLSSHIGQRIRWARGMAQIFRIDNPLLGPGLELSQRLCYANAMLHFFYGLPRIVFLTAPLAFMFFGAHVIFASASTIALYALPHLIHASATNSRMQGEFRHSFWAEVYESVLAWYILRPTLVAVINPKLGKFNVTAKGGLNANAYFDWDISKPYIILLTLNVVGFFVGIFRMFVWDIDEAGTVLLNLIWTVYNIIMLGASLSVANEARQVRSSHRVQMKIQASIRFNNGRTVRCWTTDYSEGGVGLLLPSEIPKIMGDEIHLTMYRGNDSYTFKGHVTLHSGRRIGMQFAEMTMDESADFIQCTFARADSWAIWADKREKDTPLRGLAEVLLLGIGGLKMFVKILASPIFKPSATKPIGATTKAT
jgi:cellulose synthase (UDP-forming)